MEYENPVKIINWSSIGNAYRNMRRSEVDNLFNKAEKIESTIRNNRNLSKVVKEKEYKKVTIVKNEAKQLWREIITISNTLN